MHQHSVPTATDELDNLPLLLIPTDEKPGEPPAQAQVPTAAPVALDAVGGLAAGAMAGAIAGPTGMAIGAVLGGIAGAAAGIAVERADRAKRERDAELDREIGVCEGDIEDASLDQPVSSGGYIEPLAVWEEGAEASGAPIQNVAGATE